MTASMMSHPTKIYFVDCGQHGHITRSERETYKNVVVLDVLEGNGAREHINETEDTNDDAVHSHTLRTRGRRQALDGVERLQRRVCEGVDDVEEEVRRDGATTDVEVLQAFIHLCPTSRETAIDREQEGADEGTDDENLSAGHSISEGDTAQCSKARRYGIGQVKHELHVVVIADGRINLGVEVSETVAGELTEDTHENDHECTPAGGVALVQLGVIVPALVGTIDGDVLLKLLPFEKDERVVGLTIAVKADEEVTRLLITLIGEQPTRGLGEEPDANNDDASWNSLQGERETP